MTWAATAQLAGWTPASAKAISFDETGTATDTRTSGLPEETGPSKRNYPHCFRLDIPGIISGTPASRGISLALFRRIVQPFSVSFASIPGGHPLTQALELRPLIEGSRATPRPPLVALVENSLCSRRQADFEAL
jgi:hypothetical protein